MFEGKFDSFAKILGKEKENIDVAFRIDEEMVGQEDLDPTEDARLRVEIAHRWLEDLDAAGKSDSETAEKIREYIKPYLDMYTKVTNEKIIKDNGFENVV